MLYISNLYNTVYTKPNKRKMFSKRTNSKRHNAKGYGIKKRTFLIFWFYWNTAGVAYGKQQQKILCVHTIFKAHQFNSVQFSSSVMSDSLWPHGPQHARPPCPSPTPGIYPNSCPSSQWCHPAISSSVVPFSSCPQLLPESGSFPMSQLFARGGQSIGSFSFNISPTNQHPGLISFRMD